VCATAGSPVLQGADDIIIVEGEMDKLAIDEALLQLQRQQQHNADAGSVQLSPDNHWLLNGRRVAVLSVPAGAPALTTKEAKYKYVSLDIPAATRQCLDPRRAMGVERMTRPAGFMHLRLHALSSES
jgi:hypothetical protein